MPQEKVTITRDKQNAELEEYPCYSDIQFSENCGDWQDLPDWVNFLIRFGYNWTNDDSISRRIALVSMPCDSGAAGLISLGALIRDLGKPDANIVDGHYGALLRHAKQYLDACRSCGLIKCDPSIRRCGYAEKASGRICFIPNSRKSHRISDSTDFSRKMLAWETPGKGMNGPVVHFPSSDEAIRWQVKGLPPAQSVDGEGSLIAEVYRKLLPTSSIIQENLQSSYLGLCLAGRANGKETTRKVYSNIRVRVTSGEFTLAQLLTVVGWDKANSVSRVVYFNSRTRKFEPRVATPALVVADGDSAFLNAISRKNFQNSDIIGAVHRVLSRERLEEIGARLMGLRQWYEMVPKSHYDISGLPSGIKILVLKRE